MAIRSQRESYTGVVAQWLMLCVAGQRFKTLNPVGLYHDRPRTLAPVTPQDGIWEKKNFIVLCGDSKLFLLFYSSCTDYLL